MDKFPREESSRSKSFEEDVVHKIGPKYLLEHLATFSVSKESEIFSPADGMRRLLQLEKSTGIWSQKMQLSIDEEWVLIIDYESGNVIERFSTSLIKEPTAFTSSDSMELYNNILIFIVSNESNNRSEMHIFQSLSVSAIDLVEVFKSIEKAKFNASQIQKYNDTEKLYDSNYRFSMKEISGYKEAENLREDNDDSDNDIGGVMDETSSGSSDLYERDVSVLNHCFDDIEKFIARLQHAAAATRELERRRKNRKTKKKDPGEGLLSVRTRPPQEREFIDIFSKFKLSFNLLAKLKSHIHDPNAPELVHFLFTPLALIVEAASDTYYDMQLPPQVINPLLTREAINLLINCVTSKETELWRSLGDAWVIPRDQWKGNVGSYHPVFLDGWSPDFMIIDEPAHNLSNMKRNSSRLKSVRTYDENDSYEKYKTNLESSPIGDHAYEMNEKSSSDVNVNKIANAIESLNLGLQSAGNKSEMTKAFINDSMQNDEIPIHELTKEQTIASWLLDLQKVGAKIVQVTYPRTANNDKELTVARGEFLEVLDDTRKWWKARNIHGEIAHVPHTIVAPYINSDIPTLYTGSDVSLNEKKLNPLFEVAVDSKSKQFGKKGEFRYF